MLASLQGKKTYIIAFVGAAVALAEAFGVAIPPQVYAVLAFLGIGTLRAGVAKAEVAQG
jgi:hypothetical protein